MSEAEAGAGAEGAPAGAEAGAEGAPAGAEAGAEAPTGAEAILEQSAQNRKNRRKKEHAVKVNYVLDLLVLFCIFFVWKNYSSIKEDIFFVDSKAVVLDVSEGVYRGSVDALADCRYQITLQYESAGTRYTKMLYSVDEPVYSEGAYVPIRVYVFDANEITLAGARAEH